MLKMLRKVRLPFLPKKLAEITLEERIIAALNEAKNYPLIVDNDDLSTLFKNKFVTDKGRQLPPQEFVNKIIQYIEKNPPQTAQQFAIYVKQTLAAIPPPVRTKKSWWRK